MSIRLSENFIGSQIFYPSSGLDQDEAMNRTNNNIVLPTQRLYTPSEYKQYNKLYGEKKRNNDSSNNNNNNNQSDTASSPTGFISRPENPIRLQVVDRCFVQTAGDFYSTTSSENNNDKTMTYLALSDSRDLIWAIVAPKNFVPSTASNKKNLNNSNKADDKIDSLYQLVFDEIEIGSCIDLVAYSKFVANNGRPVLVILEAETKYFMATCSLIGTPIVPNGFNLTRGNLIDQQNEIRQLLLLASNENNINTNNNNNNNSSSQQRSHSRGTRRSTSRQSNNNNNNNAGRNNQRNKNGIIPDKKTLTIRELIKLVVLPVGSYDEFDDEDDYFFRGFRNEDEDDEEEAVEQQDKESQYDNNNNNTGYSSNLPSQMVVYHQTKRGPAVRNPFSKNKNIETNQECAYHVDQNDNDEDEDEDQMLSKMINELPPSVSQRGSPGRNNNNNDSNINNNMMMMNLMNHNNYCNNNRNQNQQLSQYGAAATTTTANLLFHDQNRLRWKLYGRIDWISSKIRKVFFPDAFSSISNVVEGGFDARDFEVPTTHVINDNNNNINNHSNMIVDENGNLVHNLSQNATATAARTPHRQQQDRNGYNNDASRSNNNKYLFPAGAKASTQTHRWVLDLRITDGNGDSISVVLCFKDLKKKFKEILALGGANEESSSSSLMNNNTSAALGNVIIFQNGCLEVVPLPSSSAYSTRSDQDSDNIAKSFLQRPQEQSEKSLVFQHLVKERQQKYANRFGEIAGPGGFFLFFDDRQQSRYNGDDLILKATETEARNFLAQLPPIHPSNKNNNNNNIPSHMIPIQKIDYSCTRKIFSKSVLEAKVLLDEEVSAKKSKEANCTMNPNNDGNTNNNNFTTSSFFVEVETSLIGIIRHVTEVTQIMLDKSNQNNNFRHHNNNNNQHPNPMMMMMTAPVSRRVVMISDIHVPSVICCITLWGKNAENFGLRQQRQNQNNNNASLTSSSSLVGSAIAFRGVRVIPTQKYEPEYPFVKQYTLQQTLMSTAMLLSKVTNQNGNQNVNGAVACSLRMKADTEIIYFDELMQNRRDFFGCGIDNRLLSSNNNNNNSKNQYSNNNKKVNAWYNLTTSEKLKRQQELTLHAIESAKLSHQQNQVLHNFDMSINNINNNHENNNESGDLMIILNQQQLSQSEKQKQNTNIIDESNNKNTSNHENNNNLPANNAAARSFREMLEMFERKQKMYHQERQVWRIANDNFLKNRNRNDGMFYGESQIASSYQISQQNQSYSSTLRNSSNNHSDGDRLLPPQKPKECLRLPPLVRLSLYLLKPQFFRVSCNRRRCYHEAFSTKRFASDHAILYSKLPPDHPQQESTMIYGNSDDDGTNRNNNNHHHLFHNKDRGEHERRDDDARSGLYLLLSPEDRRAKMDNHVWKIQFPNQCSCGADEYNFEFRFSLVMKDCEGNLQFGHMSNVFVLNFLFSSFGTCGVDGSHNQEDEDQNNLHNGQENNNNNTNNTNQDESDCMITDERTVAIRNTATDIRTRILYNNNNSFIRTATNWIKVQYQYLERQIDARRSTILELQRSRQTLVAYLCRNHPNGADMTQREVNSEVDRQYPDMARSFTKATYEMEIFVEALKKFRKEAVLSLRRSLSTEEIKGWIEPLFCGSFWTANLMKDEENNNNGNGKNNVHTSLFEIVGLEYSNHKSRQEVCDKMLEELLG